MKFYKYGRNLCFYGGIITLLFLILTFFMLTDKEAFYYLLVADIILILMLVPIFIFWKKIFSKVCINNKGINVSYKKIIFLHLDWVEVVDIKLDTQLYDFPLLTFYGQQNNQITFNVTKRKLKKIIDICPDERVKTLLSNIKFPFDALIEKRQQKKNRNKQK